MLPGTAKGGIRTDLHCMPVLYGKEEDAEGIGWLKGLILQLTHETKGGFERGLSFSRRLTQRACRYLSSPFENVDKLEHEESGGKGSYTATIHWDLRDTLDVQVIRCMNLLCPTLEK
jgi:hypothetical protein